MKEFSGKIRRHTYSLAQLRERSQLASHERELGARASEHWDGGEDEGAGGAFQAWSLVAKGAVGWELSRLPEGASAISFAQLAMRLACDPRGCALLEGAERGPAGLDGFRRAGHCDRIGGAFSFCLDSVTYTAFEDPDDDYRSSMSFMVARDGNWCQNAFEPVALVPQFRRTSCDEDWDRLAWDDLGEDDLAKRAADPRNWRQVPPSDERAAHADILDLLVPGGKESVVSVGTSRSDSYYPCFVGYFGAEPLQRARDLNVVLAYELEDSVRNPDAQAARPRKGRSGL